MSAASPSLRQAQQKQPTGVQTTFRLLFLIGPAGTLVLGAAILGIAVCIVVAAIVTDLLPGISADLLADLLTADRVGVHVLNVLLRLFSANFFFP